MNPATPSRPDGERCPASRRLTDILGSMTTVSIPTLEFRCTRPLGHDGEHRSGSDDEITWWDDEPPP